jgi:hypothetical protein
MEVEMTQVFFHCSTARKVFLDPRGAGRARRKEAFSLSLSRSIA